jgi:predicted secreted acid phosphatase
MPILDQVLSQAAALQGGGVVVFDLDSTLLDNRPRQARILREFGQLHNLPALAAAQPEHWDGWDLAKAMRNTGFEDVERWVGEARSFWKQRFFTSEYCVVDEAIEGAVKFVHEVRKRGALVAYCTGRHEEMRQGSVSCFERLGFPRPGEGVHLLMKPRLDVHDDEYKATACAEIRGLGRVVAAFDNEPTHANSYRREFPEAQIVHLATDHSGRDVVLLEGIVSIPHFSVT